MILSIIVLILKILSINQIDNPFEGIPPEEWFDIPSMWLWVLGWIFLGLGLTTIVVLILYTKYGREVSIKLSIITILVAAIFLGFSFHFLLLNYGL